MRKLSRSAYEDTKGLVRAAETLLEVVVMTCCITARSARDTKSNILYTRANMC